MYSLINQRKNASKGCVTLKIAKIYDEKVGEVLEKSLNFQKILKNETSTIYFMNKQSMLSDIICILTGDKGEINSKLTILSK